MLQESIERSNLKITMLCYRTPNFSQGNEKVSNDVPLLYFAAVNQEWNSSENPHPKHVKTGNKDLKSSKRFANYS